MKASVDKDTCIGCGLCTSICEEVFQMEDDGKAGVMAEPKTDEVIDKAKDAESSCPVSAITVG
ncbi:ferredoxin [uncultured Clostridium sp.]|uniref:ferredoxin n=1 Tax=uncultured Clostridium sp. TaxID=59620 RepID=UPI002633C3BD|nr:ferredoxin [uncultured Clostridium sp.]